MSLNKVMLIGRLGKDPEKRQMPSGDALVTFSLATSENWKDKDGMKQERTEWHNIVIFGKLGEIAATYLKKGQQVYVEGRISSRKYTGKDNVERTYYEIIVNQMTMLGSKDSGAVAFDSPADSNARNSAAAPAAMGRSIPPVEDKKLDIAGIDSDIPF